MRIKNYLNGIEGVLAGGVASVNVPVNRRYHALALFVFAMAGGNPITDPALIIDNVRLMVNGVVMRDLSPAEIRAIATLNGEPAANNEIPIYFSEPWRASVTGEEVTSWDLFGQTKCTLEVKFKSGIDQPSMKVLASFDYGRNVTPDGKGNPVPFLAIVKQLGFSYNAPAGSFDLTTLPVRFPIQRIHLDASAGAISAVEVYRDAEKVHEASATENARLLSAYDVDATAFDYPILFDYEQQISSPLIVSRDLNVKATLTQAATLRAIVEHRANGYV